MKKDIHFLFLLLIMISLSIPANSQAFQADTISLGKKPNRLRYFSLGFNSNQIFYKDRFNSVMRYKGHISGLDLGYRKYGPKSYNEIDFSIQGGLANKQFSNGEVESGIQIMVLRPELKYDHLRYIPRLSGESFNTWIGGNSQLTGSLRRNLEMSNSAYAYDVFFNLGFSGGFDYNFRWKERNFRIFYMLGIPILGLTLRPHYGLLWEGKTLTSSSFGIWNNFFSLDTKLELHYFLKNGNFVAIGFDWFYTNIKEPHQLKISGLGANLLLAFKF